MISWQALIFAILFIGVGMMSGIYLQKRLIPGRVKRAILPTVRLHRARNFQERSELFNLTVRDFKLAEQPGGPNTEKDGQHISRSLKISTAEAALILIDVWADHPVKGWQARADENVRKKLQPLVKKMRENGVLVVHSPHGEEIHPLVKPTNNDIIIDDPDEQVHLNEILKERGIRYLFYGGYASNMCILGRPTGIFEMAKRGYEIIFVRDASLAIESPEFLEDQLTHKVVTYIIEANWGVSTDVSAVLSALYGGVVSETTVTTPLDDPIRQPQSVPWPYQRNPKKRYPELEKNCAELPDHPPRRG